MGQIDVNAITIYNMEPFCRLLEKMQSETYSTITLHIQHHRSWYIHGFLEFLPSRMASPLTSACMRVVHDSKTGLFILFYKYTRVYPGYLTLLRSIWSRIMFMRLVHIYSLPLKMHSSKCVGASFLAACVYICVLRSSWPCMLSTDVIPNVLFHVIKFITPELTISVYNPSEMILEVCENSFDYAQFTVVLQVLMSL